MRNFKLIFAISLMVCGYAFAADTRHGTPESVMAVRGKGVVTQRDFDARIAKIPADARKEILRSGDRVQKLLANLLLSSQIVADARLAGFDKGEEVEARMKLAAESELANAWLDHYVQSQPDANYTEMAHEYYLLNQEKFMTVQRVDVTHLLVSTKDRSLDEAIDVAQTYLDQIKADPSIFNALLMQYSDDPSVATNKGHFAGVKKGDMVPEFEKAAFALREKGDFSELVQTSYGIHIIRLDEFHPARRQRFEEVQEKLESTQAKKHRERIRNNYLSQLASMEVKISDKEIEVMVKRYFGDDNQAEDQQASSPSPEAE